MRKFGLSLRVALKGLISTAYLWLAASGTYAAEVGSEVPSAEDFSRIPALSSPTISPDGKHVAAVISPDGKTTQIVVWDTSDFSKAVGLSSVRKLQFRSVAFVKNDRLFMGVQQSYNTSHQVDAISAFTDLNGSKWLQGADVIGYLPDDPENVLVKGGCKYNLTTGKLSRCQRQDGKDRDFKYDDTGELRAKSRADYENGNMYFIQLLKSPETGVWEEHFRAYAKDREIPEIVAFTKDPNIVLVAARRGKDHIAIYDYDIKARAFKSVAFEHPLFDVDSVSINHRTGEIIAFTFMADRPTQYYVDDELDATMVSIGQDLGIKTKKIVWTDLSTGKDVAFTVADGASVKLVDYSDDLKNLIIERSGPSTPEEYYLYLDGQGLLPLGAARPYVNTKLLGEGHLDQFTARDGRPIPAFVFTPNIEKYGKGPYPTLIVPHGGPWARDYLEWELSSYWVQYFVTRGYVVAEPQFRGSDGWGYAQWSAGDNQWGQKMSDDIDDVALGLVKQGVADRNRLAMHGYSFGGYSAMAAIVRPNPIYQCAIAGAGSASPASMRNVTFDNRFEREFQRPFVGGLDAQANVDKASIPILIYHGDHDQTVMPEESKAFYDALQKAHKPSWRVVFKDMGHTANKWTTDDAAHMLTMIDTFLKTDCRAGGL